MIDAAGDFDFLVLPGRNNSGADHWLSHWCRAFPNSSRVLQADWHQPDPQAWIGRLDAAVQAAPRRVVLLAHSLAVATTVKWAVAAASAQTGKVAGAFLVAPTNVEDPDPSFDLVRPFAPMPLQRLPFPALVVASRTDHARHFRSGHQLCRRLGRRTGGCRRPRTYGQRNEARTVADGPASARPPAGARACLAGWRSF